MGNLLQAKKNLVINDGGLRNKEASTSLKKLFTEMIKPSLMEIMTALDKNLNGKLMLHFAEGDLQKIDIVAK